MACKQFSGGSACLAAGRSHTAVILNNGRLQAFGWKKYGQCEVPDAIQGHCAAVAAGAHHTVALLKHGRLRAFGLNNNGQCEVPDEIQGNCAEVAAGGCHTVALLKNGRLHAFGANHFDQCEVPDGIQGHCAAVAVGGNHTVALLKNGRLCVFGWNNYGQCEVPDAIQGHCAAVAAGVHHTVALLKNGRLHAFGDNDHGQCQVPDAIQGHCAAVAAGDRRTVALLKNGRLRAFGDNEHGQSEVPDEIQGHCAAVAAGAAHTVALLSSGRLHAFGENNYGQCQDPEATKVVMLGSPGSGKSTIANCVARKVMFNSGGSVGEGLTKLMQIRTDSSGRQWVDLPGLSDVKIRPEAAREYTKALHLGGLMTILFVFQESNGRIRVEDRITLKLVLQAAMEIGTNYGIIINQCGKYVMRHCIDANWRSEFERILMENVPQATQHIYYMPRYDELEGRRDRLLDLDNEGVSKLNSFIDNVPKAKLTPDKIIPVNPADPEVLITHVQILEDQRLNQIEDQIALRRQNALESKRRAEESDRWHAKVAFIAGCVFLMFSAALALVLYKSGAYKYKMKIRIGCCGLVVIPIWRTVILSLYAMYATYANIATWCSPSKGADDPFELMKRKFLFCDHYLLVRHAWVAMQLPDTLVDTWSCMELFEQEGITWISALWLFTTMVSFSVPLAYLLGKITLDRAMLYELAGEDIIQMVITLWKIFEGSGKTLSIALIFSSIFAILSCIGNVGRLSGRLLASPETDSLRPLLSA